MPLDPMLAEAILGTFRNMVEEIKEKECTGEDVDKMFGYYDRMVELTQIHSDMNEFNGQIMQENVYMKFSDHYGRVLSEIALKEQDKKGYDDATILKQMVDALKGAVKRLRDAKQEAIDLSNSYNPNKAIEDGMAFLERNSDGMGISLSKRQIKKMTKAAKNDVQKTLVDKPNAGNNSHEIDVLINHEPIIEAIQVLIDLGEEEGMTTPRFLITQMEKGLDKAMGGGKYIYRDRYEHDLEWAKAMAVNPFYIKKEEDKIKAYDELAKVSDFNIPNIDELNFIEEKIEHKYEPEIIKWSEIVGRWEDLIYDLSHWSMSYCRVAPNIQPWSMAANPKKSVKDTQNIQPGLFKERERLFEKYFGISFLDVFKHPSFKWNVEHFTLSDSQEFIEFLIEKVYPQCLPGDDLDRSTTKERQRLYEEKREGNPDYAKPLLRFMAFYDHKFGEGHYLTKYSAPAVYQRNSEPWNWESFKHKD